MSEENQTWNDENATCEYCEELAVYVNGILGNVCEDCYDKAFQNEDLYGRFSVGVEEDWDLVRDQRDGF